MQVSKITQQQITTDVPVSSWLLV